MKDAKYMNMTEEEIRASPPTPSLNLFLDNEMRVLNIRHRDGVFKIEDRVIDLPVNDLLELVEGSETDEEDEDAQA